MKTKCLSSDRNMILRVMETELGERAVYCPSPEFAYTIGHCRLQRDGFITTQEGNASIFVTLARLGLCDFQYEPQPPGPGTLACTMKGHNGTSLMNLVSIFSARQRLLNQALDAKGAFYVSEGLMSDLLAHPPETICEFLQALYKRDTEYDGFLFSCDHIQFTGFQKGHPEEACIHHQLADRMIETARSKRWIKPFTANVRNRKYAFRTWLNALGMIGPEYEDARRILLGRLYGRSDQRSIVRGKEKT